MGPTLIWLVAVAATLVVLPALVVGCAIWRKRPAPTPGAQRLGAAPALDPLLQPEWAKQQAQRAQQQQQQRRELVFAVGRRPLQTHDGVANDDGAEQGVLVMRMPSTCDPHALPAHLAKQLNNQNYQLPSRHPSPLPRSISQPGSGSESEEAATPRPAVGAPLRKTSFLPTLPADELQESSEEPITPFLTSLHRHTVEAAPNEEGGRSRRGAALHWAEPDNNSHPSPPLRSSSINVALRNSITAPRASSNGAAAAGLSRHCSGSLSPRVPPPPASAATLRRMRSPSQRQAMPPQLHNPTSRMNGSNSGSTRGDLLSQRRQTASGNGRGLHADLPSGGVGGDVSVDAVKRIRRRPEAADDDSSSSDDGGGGGSRTVSDGSSDCESGGGGNGGGDYGLNVRPSVSGTSGLPSWGLPSHGAATDGGLSLSRRLSYQTSLSSSLHASRHRAAALSPVTRAATTTSVEQYDDRRQGSAAAAVPAKRLSSYGSSQVVNSAASVRSAAVIGSRVAAVVTRQAGAVRLLSSPQPQGLASPKLRITSPALMGGNASSGGGNSPASPVHGRVSRAGSYADMGQGRGSRLSGRSAIALLKEARRTREQQRQVAAAAIATAAATAAAAGASGGIEDLLAELCSSSAAPVVPSSGATPYGKRGGAALHSPEALSYTERVYDSGGGGVVREPESSLPGTAERDHQEPLSVHGLTHQPQPRALGPGGGDNFGGGGAALAAQRTVSHGGGGGAAIHSWSGLVDVSAGPVRGAASGSASGGGGGGGNAIGGVPLIPVAPGGRAARAVELLSRARSNLGRANAGGSGPQPSGALSPV